MHLAAAGNQPKVSIALSPE